MFKSSKEKRMKHTDAKILYGLPMAQTLPFADIEFDEGRSLKK